MSFLTRSNLTLLRRGIVEQSIVGSGAGLSALEFSPDTKVVYNPSSVSVSSGGENDDNPVSQWVNIHLEQWLDQVLHKN